MADYKRMVSYMYQYENGLKRKNVGYARVEQRSGQIKITLHMQLLGQLDTVFPTYLIQRNDKGLDLIYLGDSLLKTQVLDSKLTADEANLLGVGHNFTEIGGILIFLNEDVFYATEWDDKPILVKEVMEAMKPKSLKDKDKKEFSGVSEKEKILEKVVEEPPGEELKLSKEVTTSESDGKILEIDLVENDIKSEDIKQNEYLLPKYKLPGGYKFLEGFKKTPATQSDQLLISDIAQNIEIESNHDDKNNMSVDKKESVSVDKTETKTIDAKIYENEKRPAIQETLQDIFIKEKEFQEELIHNATVRNEAAEKATIQEPQINEVKYEKVESQEEVERQEEAEKQVEYVKKQEENLKNQDEEMDNSSAARIFEHYPRIYPFEDNEITMCVKIEPKDIGYLPMDVWGLSNNSFLLHGFYCYHHLIFAKIKDRYGCRYILGVPGIYNSKEQFMARMFGFESFKSIRKRELRQGDFGYWFLAISM